MDWLIILAVVLFIGWALGLFAFHVGSLFIHVLLVLCIVIIVIRLLQGRRMI